MAQVTEFSVCKEYGLHAYHEVALNCIRFGAGEETVFTGVRLEINNLGSRFATI